MVCSFDVPSTPTLFTVLFTDGALLCAWGCVLCVGGGPDLRIASRNCKTTIEYFGFIYLRTLHTGDRPAGHGVCHLRGVLFYSGCTVLLQLGGQDVSCNMDR